MFSLSMKTFWLLINLIVVHIVVEDDAIIIRYIVPISENERLSLKRN